MSQISLIATVYNDLEGTRLFLDRMEEQTRRPDEIVICDAGSHDGTWELLLGYSRSGAIPLVALQESRCRPARGRNLAGKAARHDILAVTDIGCDWECQWFENLVQPFETIPGLEAVLGSWKVRWDDQHTCWAKADYVLQGGLELHAAPTSHSANRSIAYTKEFYFGLGGLPEDLTFAADDMVLALLIQSAARSKAAAPMPSCYWSRPQTLKALLKEARRNSRGDGEADIHRAHTILTLGRFGLETIILCAGLTAAMNANSFPGAAVVAAVGIAPICMRIRRLQCRQQECARLGKESPLTSLIVLDYGRKIWSWLGYIEGWLHGLKDCRQCRTRLRVHGVPPW